MAVKRDDSTRSVILEDLHPWLRMSRVRQPKHGTLVLHRFRCCAATGISGGTSGAFLISVIMNNHANRRVVYMWKQLIGLYEAQVMLWIRSQVLTSWRKEVIDVGQERNGEQRRRKSISSLNHHKECDKSLAYKVDQLGAQIWWHENITDSNDSPQSFTSMLFEIHVKSSVQLLPSYKHNTPVHSWPSLLNFHLTSLLVAFNSYNIF